MDDELKSLSVVDMSALTGPVIFLDESDFFVKHRETRGETSLMQAFSPLRSAAGTPAAFISSQRKLVPLV